MLIGLEKVKSLMAFQRTASFKCSMAADLRIKEILGGEIVEQ